MPNALGIGLLGPLQVRDETGRPVHVGGRQLRVLLTLLALNAGRVVPAGSLAGELWPDDPPGNPGNALQTLVSRLRAELRQAGAGDVIESDPGGYRLAVPPEAVDVMAFEELAAQGRRALADGDAAQAARVLRDALLAWRGQPLADAAGSDLAEATAARLTELRSSILADRIEADLALGEGASLVLPTPPGPVSVTRRAARRLFSTRGRSSSRPTKLVRGVCAREAEGRAWAATSARSVLAFCSPPRKLPR